MSANVAILLSQIFVGDIFLHHISKLNDSTKIALKHSTERYFRGLQPRNINSSGDFVKFMLIAIRESHDEPIDFLLRNVHRGYEPADLSNSQRSDRNYIYHRLLNLSPAYLPKIVRIISECPPINLTQQELIDIGDRNNRLVLLMNSIVSNVIPDPGAFELFVNSQKSKMLPEDFERFVKQVRSCPAFKERMGTP
jgi:hypothetical protein